MSKLKVSHLAAQALQSGGAPQPGARVLIQGGSGGVGHFAIQLAKVHFKAYVVATGGPSNQGFMKVCRSRRLSPEACAETVLCMVSATELLKKAVQPQAFHPGASDTCSPRPALEGCSHLMCRAGAGRG